MGRLWQTFNLPAGVAAYLNAMNPDVPLAALWHDLTSQQWPRIRREIDRGIPVTLNLVQIRSRDPLQLGANHQVLAFGYDLSGTRVRLDIYDPNFGAPAHLVRNERTLTFDVADPSIGLRYNPTRNGVPLFHAFMSPYEPVSPPGPGAERVDGWAGWTPRGALPDGRLAEGTPCLAANADGRAEVFVRASGGAVFHSWQVAPNGGWSAWRTFDGTLQGDPFVVSTASGRMMVLGRGVDGNIWHRTQTAPANGWPPAWTPIRPGRFTGDPVAARNADGRIEVFGRGGNGAVWHIWQDGPDGAWAANWEPLGDLRVGADFTVAANADGALELFALGEDRSVWHCRQPVAAQSWSAWESLGGHHDGRPAAAANPDGRLEVFALGRDRAIGRRWQAGGPRGAWLPIFWEATGNPAGRPLAGRTVPVLDESGRLNVMVRGADSRLYVRRQDSPGGWLDPWMDLQGDGFSGDASVGRDANGRLLLSAIRHGQVWLNSHDH